MGAPQIPAAVCKTGAGQSRLMPEAPATAAASPCTACNSRVSQPRAILLPDLPVRRSNDRRFDHGIKTGVPGPSAA